jgi:hypothetical protein
VLARCWKSSASSGQGAVNLTVTAQLTKQTRHKSRYKLHRYSTLQGDNGAHTDLCQLWSDCRKCLIGIACTLTGRENDEQRTALKAVDLLHQRFTSNWLILPIADLLQKETGLSVNERAMAYEIENIGSITERRCNSWQGGCRTIRLPIKQSDRYAAKTLLGMSHFANDIDWYEVQYCKRSWICHCYDSA